MSPACSGDKNRCDIMYDMLKSYSDINRSESLETLTIKVQYTNKYTNKYTYMITLA